MYFDSTLRVCGRTPLADNIILLHLPSRTFAELFEPRVVDVWRPKSVDIASVLNLRRAPNIHLKIAFLKWQG